MKKRVFFHTLSMLLNFERKFFCVYFPLKNLIGQPVEKVKKSFHHPNILNLLPYSLYPSLPSYFLAFLLCSLHDQTNCLQFRSIKLITIFHYYHYFLFSVMVGIGVTALPCGTGYHPIVGYHY